MSERHAGRVALIDAADLPLVAGRRWNGSPGHQPGSGSVIVALNGTPRPSLARVLLGLDDPKQLVGHRNGYGLDCRRENLVVRTRGQVARASRKLSARKGVARASRFKGVKRTENGGRGRRRSTPAGRTGLPDRSPVADAPARRPDGSTARRLDGSGGAEDAGERFDNGEWNDAWAIATRQRRQRLASIHDA